MSFRRVALWALVVSLLVLGTALPSLAATDTVNSLADDGSAGTLRSVMAAASVGDTIAFSMTGTIILNCTAGYGPLVISQNLTISGPGAANLAISGSGGSNGPCEVFSVSSGVTATISGVTIENGFGASGGGIYNQGTLTVTNSVLSGNSCSADGAGIYNSNTGTLTVSNSTISGNSTNLAYGGGIYNNGMLTVSNSTLSVNSAGLDGGGIANVGTLTVSNSTLSGNSTHGYGGGIYNSGALTVSNSTLAYNPAGQFGGGIANVGTLTLKGTLLAAQPGGNCYLSGGSAASDGYNLSDDTSCTFLTATSDQNASATTVAGLSPSGLQPNGGPTQTIALVAGTSTAIDYIPVNQCTDAFGNLVSTDQRGVSRPQGKGCDIGAFELAQPVPTANVCPNGQTTPTPCRYTITLDYYIPSGTTLSSSTPLTVVTQGIPLLDFTLATVSNPTLAGLAGPASFVVGVTFAPLAPGLRLGAVNLTDSSGNVFATFIHGIGQGPQVSFLPGSQSTLGGGFSTLYGIAVDASGNVFVSDFNSNTVNEIRPPCPTSACVTTLGGGFSGPRGLAVDGGGNVIVADFGNNAVKAIPPGCTTSSCVINLATAYTAGGGFNNPTGVAVDGGGNVFVADFGNSAVKEILAGGYTTVNPLGSGFNSPQGVAVDGSDNVYVADSFNNAVKEILAASSYTTVNPLGSGFNDPVGIAVDASGDVYVGDANNHALKVILAASSYTTVNTLGSSFEIPYGVALDASGNVYVADDGDQLVLKLDYADAPGLTFPTPTIDGSTDATDGAMSVTVQNIGNAALNAVAPGLAIGPDFTQVAGSGTPTDCTSTFALTPGASCNLSIEFAPKSPANGPLSESATFTDNALNASPSASQSIALSGTGTPSPATHFSVTASSPQTAGVSFTFTVTALNSSNSTATGYTGTVQFSSSDGLASLPAGYTFTTGAGGDNGVHTFLVTLNTPPTQTITATDTVNSAITGTSSPITINPATYLLTTAASPSGSGTVTPATGTYYAAGTVVNLTETPSAGYVFSSWGGSRVAVVNSKVTMSAAPETVTAYFTSALTISPNPVNFGNVHLNTTPSKTVTLTNISTLPLTITSVTIPGSNSDGGSQPPGDPDDFQEFNNCGKTLAAGKSCTITVYFIADNDDYNQQYATLTIKDSAAGSPQTVGLTATVINPVASFKPSSLNFGSVEEGKSSTQTITLTNTGSGNTPLMINSIGVTGSNASDFSQTNNCPSSLTPGSHCTITVMFKPSTTGSFSANITVKDNAQNPTQNVSLSGRGSH